MPDRKRRFAGQDADQLTVKLFLLLRRQAGPQVAIRGGTPEAGELGRIDGVDGLGLALVERRRQAAVGLAL